MGLDDDEGNLTRSTLAMIHCVVLFQSNDRANIVSTLGFKKTPSVKEDRGNFSVGTMYDLHWDRVDQKC